MEGVNFLTFSLLKPKG